MPDFLDIDQVTLRGGPQAFKYGDPYTASVVAKVEHDRFVYLTVLTGDYKDFRSGLRKIQELGKAFGWKGIRWERIRNGEIHLVEFKFNE